MEPMLPAPIELAPPGLSVPGAGSLPELVLDGAPAVAAKGRDAALGSIEPAVRGWRYDARTLLLRQSLFTHFEAPFLTLLLGSRRALLLDTGTGDADVRRAIDGLLAGYGGELVVAHTHAHDDHVGGDGQFVGRARTTIVGHSLLDVRNTFGLGGSGRGGIDLGDRRIDVLAIPGHEAAHVAFYDPDTRLLLTGDTLYPGRLYVRDWAAYVASVGRLVDFVDDGHAPSHVLGAHIELSADDVEYPERATLHPNEHPLPLAETHLRDLKQTVDAMASAPVRTKRRSFVVVPLL